jgi:hypothetical protein
VIATAFSKLRENLELSDTLNGLIEQRHKAVRSNIENLDGSLSTKLIGSLQRKTRIHPRPGDKFDIDILVEMGQFDHWRFDGQGVTAKAALQHLEGVVNESKRYSAMRPRVDAPTVTYDYEDTMKVELVPAYANNIGHDPSGHQLYPVGRGYWVAKEHGWEFADYDEDAKTLSRLNAECNGLLIPTIKIIRAIRREYFPQMSPFHVDVMAAHVVPLYMSLNKKFGIESTYPQLVRDFFSGASDRLGRQIVMPGGLGTSLSLTEAERVATASVFDTLKRYAEWALTLAPDKQLESWRKVFGSLIPQDIYA